MLGNIYFNGKLVKEFKAEFPMKNGLKRNKFIGGGVLVLAQQQVKKTLIFFKINCYSFNSSVRDSFVQSSFVQS